MPTARAETASALQQQLDAVREQAKLAETELAAVAAQARVARAELDVAEQQAAEADWAYETIAAEAAKVAGQVQQLEADLAQSQAHLAQRKEVVAARLRSLQERGRVSYLEVLFGATSFTDFISRLDLLGVVLRKDRAVFEEVKQATTLIEERQQAAVVRKRELETLQAQALAKQQVAEEQRSIREVASRSLTASQRRWQAELDELEKAADRILYQVALL